MSLQLSMNMEDERMGYMPGLRALQLEDVDKIYEWMTDADVTDQLAIGRYPSSKEQINEFIKNSWRDRDNIHFAIVTDDNDYVGTVSLKNINYVDRNAEYAIVIHKDYWGKNYSKLATDQIIAYGFKKMNLHKIYLNVISSNTRATRFYEKYGFEKEGTFKKHFFSNGKLVDLNWYCIFNR